MEDDFVERRIIVGLIVSSTYIREISKIWNPKLLDSTMAKVLASWCFEYFIQYQKSPGKDILGTSGVKKK